MAYGAVACLQLKIERLLNSSRISIVENSSPQILKHLYDEIISVTEALGEFNTRRSTINMKAVKTLEAEIIDTIYKFDDVIESHVLDQFHSQSEEEETDHSPSMLYSVDLQELKQDVDSFIETMNTMKRAYIHELCNPSPDDCVVSSGIDFGGNESNMVGLSHLFMQIKDRLNSSRSELMFVSLSGMAGIGKTTIAKKLFQDPFVASRYRTRVFVTVGPKYQLADILVDILRQVNSDIDEVVLMESIYLLEELKTMVLESLLNLTYLIVLDDVWNTEVCDGIFAETKNGSRVLLTTRIEQVAHYPHPLMTFSIPFLDKKESWDLLREKVFGDQQESSSFSYEFAKAGKKIAENCEGLPLTIVTVANILSGSEKLNLEYWNEVAAEKQHSVYKDAYDQMSKVLYPSYDYLPQQLKACFLYIGTFPQSDSIDMIRLINLWSAEGFRNSKAMHYLDSDNTTISGILVYFNELYQRNLIMDDTEESGFRLHSSFWYLCTKEAAKTKLFYALDCRADALPEEGNLKCPLRLCIRNNVLLAIEDLHNSIASASTLRSLLFTGKFHKYPVPLCVEHLWLLRVLDAISIRFYEFPLEVLKLVQLTYLSLTCDGNLPTSISKLWNLQYLIVDQHLIIKKNSSYLPIEIWNMKELKFLETTGRDLPHPSHEGSLLPNLVELFGVGPQSCTKDVLEKIPNLNTLFINIQLAPDGTESLSCFDHISHLHHLKDLACVVVNPILQTMVSTPLAPPLSDLPSSLTKLALSGLGYPWEQMSKISSLPNLRHMTLQCYAFRGPKWEVRDNEFQSLVTLDIADTDLEQWTFANYSCLPAISYLTIAHCYMLKEIPETFGASLQTIDLVDCNPIAVNCASKLQQDWDDKYGDGKRSLLLDVRSSL